MGAKGKVTSLVAKKDLLLAERIEEAIRKDESWESLTAVIVRRDVARARMTEQKGKNAKLIKVSNQKSKSLSSHTSGKKSSSAKSVKASSPANPSKSKVKASSPTKPLKAKVKLSKPLKSEKSSSVGKNRKSSAFNSTAGKLSLVGFRGQAASLRPP
ncbi:hypothetical protein SLEP1_g4699 [Rubroshorea leprosula]|uniref:Uncharacterized protein n=1 Tax=Rubroshorea leprosula TaxID=152421 RepID=A0AAV5I0B1_9ROSI|nr:hypothetical protein SLEP1_g4699 [Rubroshorea leprosula]